MKIARNDGWFTRRGPPPIAEIRTFPFVRTSNGSFREALRGEGGQRGGLAGARPGLTVGFAAMIVSAVIGTIVGALVAFIPPSVLSITLIIGFTSWMATVRLVRGRVHSLLQPGFVEAEKAGGFADLRIIAHRVLPNSTAPIVVTATLNAADAILAESYVSFLGYGIRPPWPAGATCSIMPNVFVSAPWLAIFLGR